MKITSRRSHQPSLAFPMLLFALICSCMQLKAQTASGIPAKPEDISPLLIGEKIPAIQVPDATGKIFDLNAAVSKQPTILIFYRGGWCPYCNKQLAGLQEIEPELKNMGYQIIAISTDSPDNLKSSTTKNKLGYTLLSDAGLNVSKQFGLAYKGPAAYDKFLPETSGGKNVDKLLPVPAVFFISKIGMIRFEYINVDFKQRISADLLKAVAKVVLNEL